jgi:cell division protease FtsH
LSKKLRNIIIGVVLGLILLLIGTQVAEGIIVKKGDLVKFEQLVNEDKIENILVKETLNELTYSTKNNIYKMRILRNYFEINPAVLETLKKNEVDVTITSGVNAGNLISQLVSVLILVVIMFYLFKMLNGMNKVNLENIKKEGTKFDDVGGLDNVKKELKTLVAYLKDPEALREYVDKIPKGILFEGDPGNGKTLLARVIAGESDTPFFYISGADIEGSYVAQGAGRVGNIFKQVKKAAKEHGKAILFIDELDSIGTKREKRTVVETGQTINKILTELDGFNQNENVLVIGATNLASQLDSALVRSGRFDRIIKIPMPGLADRKKILDLYLSKKIEKVDPKIFDINYVEVMAKQTEGFSGADLERLVNDAALLAFENRGLVDIKSLRESFLGIVMGLPREGAMSAEDEKIVAYHEAAHAVIAMATSNIGVHAVSYGTIKAYGQFGGHVSIVDDPTFLYKKSDFSKIIPQLLAGRAIEDRILNGDYTSGASNDLMKVNKLIYRYIVEYGMSSSNENLYIDTTLTDLKSDWIQNEVKEIRDKMYAETKLLVEDNFEEIEILTNYLLEHKEIDQDKLIELFINKYPSKK